MIVAVGERPPGGVRAGQDVVLVLALRRAHARNLIPLGIEDARALDVVAVALLIAVQIGDVAGDQHALDVVPGAGADARARIDPRRVAALLLAEIGVPRALGSAAADRLGLGLANLVGACEPAKVAAAGRVLGNKEAGEIRAHLRLLLLRLGQRRSKKHDGNCGKSGPSPHWISSMVTRGVNVDVHLSSRSTFSVTC